jgi:polyhydroxyalkanoate synthase subunit PhaC
VAIRTVARGEVRGAQAALDVMLTDAALVPRRRFLPVGSAVKLGARLAARPGTVARRVGGAAGGLARVTRGTDAVRPAPGDRRFADPAWGDSAVFRRLMQGYLVAGSTVDALIDDARLDLQDERRVRFAAENALDALAPSNFPITNPIALRTAVETRGASLARGARNLARDVSRSPRLPASVDASQFTVGANLALTPGSVVLRTEVFELIHYRPQTKTVHSVPVLLAPPMINKFYIADLAPGRSLVEFLVRQGHQVLAISWRNPDERHGHWDLDTYGDAIAAALDAATDITDSDVAHLLGFCSGGIVAAAVAGHLAATDALDRVAGLTLGVCVIDNERAGVTSALVNREIAATAVAESARRGYLDGNALAGVFAWLRPNDLIWSYVVNNYLLGKRPPAFDILYWNGDTTRMTAGVHRDFVRLALDNTLSRPGELEMLGTPVDLSAVTVDSYVVAGIADHITPWESCYRTTQLLGGDTRFVLSTSGHIAAIVNPPGNAKASFRVNDGGTPAGHAAWLADAEQRPGSWWTDWAAWLGERSGAMRPAPRGLGNARYRAACKAPGTYVLAR